MVRINRTARRPDQVALIAKDREYLRLMQEHLLLGQHPHRLILIDECIFSAKTFQPMAWSERRRNVAQCRQMGSQKAVAVVAAVSADAGLILFERRPSSFNGQQFSEYLERLHALVADQPMAVLLDNCKIHKARVTTEVVERLDINMIWNVPYRPDLNGIEFVWAIAKRRFRQLQLQRMMGTLNRTFEECVDQAMADLTQEQISNCCRHGLSNILNAEII